MFLVWKKHAFDVLLFHISISILFYHTNGILNVTYVPYGTIPEEYATNLTSSDESYIATNSYKITSQNFTTSEDPTPYDYVGLIQCADYFYVPNDTSCIPYKVSFIVTRSQNDMAPNITYIGIY